MALIKIALLQMTACANDQDANLAKGEAFCRRACEMGADIALFPEILTSTTVLSPTLRRCPEN
jgi:predicted amidohydrolase